MSLLLPLLLAATALAGRPLEPERASEPLSLPLSGEPAPAPGAERAADAPLPEAEDWWPLDWSHPLVFPVEGPLTVELRVRRYVAPEAFPTPSSLSLRGDGREILRLSLNAGPDPTLPGGDDGAPRPSLPETALVEVPPGAHELSLVALDTEERFLARLEIPDGPLPVSALPSPGGPGEAGGGEAEAELERDVQEALERAGGKETAVVEEPAAPPRTARWALGPRLGAGTPLRGDAPLTYLGAELRWERPGLALQLTAGSYRVQVHEERAVLDPHLDPFELESDWSTRAYPLELGLLLPVGRSAVHPVLGGGGGLALLQRSGDGGGRRSLLAGSALLRAGLEARGPGGTFSLCASWNGVRADFGQPGTGGTAREQLGSLRLDLSLLYAGKRSAP